MEPQLGPPAPGLQRVLGSLQAEYARCDTVVIGIHVRYGGAEFTAQQPHELPYEDQREYLFGSLEYAPDGTLVPSLPSARHNLFGAELLAGALQAYRTP